jgi:hypothetical protein
MMIVSIGTAESDSRIHKDDKEGERSGMINRGEGREERLTIPPHPDSPLIP